MNKNYELELPSDYELAIKINAKESKIGTIFTLASIGILILVMGICLIPFFVKGEFINFDPTANNFYIIEYLVFFASMIAYVVLHELVHGIAYKALTKQKLTFGITWSCAFCGVPNIYCYRKTALIALIAPLITFSIILIPLVIILYFVNPLYYLIYAFILGLHFGGCIGDIYMTILLLTKYKSPSLLIKDTGPEQTLYIKK